MKEQFYERAKEIGFKAAVKEIERYALLRALSEAENKTQSAKLLKMNRTTLMMKLKPAGIVT